MDEGPVVLGLNRTQDASACLLHGSRLVWAIADLTEHWRGATDVSGEWRDVSSFYYASREQIECIAKQVWDRDDARLVRLGMFYFIPLSRSLLLGFEARTGVPILLNTSFNGKDEPIVETPHEALDSFRRMPLHALAMPPFWIRKRIEPELPE